MKIVKLFITAVFLFSFQLGVVAQINDSNSYRDYFEYQSKIFQLKKYDKSSDEFRVIEILNDTIETSFGSNKLISENDLKYDSAYKPHKRYLIPAIEVIGLNLSVWAMDRYIGNAPWARISVNSIKENFKHAFVWDADNFGTNQFMHPYHGNTYFNFARSSGLSFWESAPYSFGGSLMWEFFMETNYPSRNDLISTTLGGISIGEMAYRLSSLIIDERTTGKKRTWREIGAFVIAPTRGINRFIYGDMTKIRHKSIYEIEPVTSSVTVGPSYIFREGQMYKGNGNFSVRLDLYYGNPYAEKSRKPFDFFNVKGILSFGAQPVINQVNIYGFLFGKNYKLKNNQRILVGMFQYYDYYDNIYYRIGAQSFGTGVIYHIPTLPDVHFENSLHVAGIVLGGGSNIKEAFKYEADGTAFRDYNFGIGFTNKFESIVKFKNKGYIFLGLYNYMIYTLDGAEGNDNLIIFNPRIAVSITPKLDVGFEYNYYRRKSNYKKYDDFLTKVIELKLFISNSF